MRAHVGWRAHAVSGEPDGCSDQSCLLLNVGLRTADGQVRKLEALVDTGADINLVRRGLVPSECLTASARPLYIVAANQVSLGGNHRELRGELLISGQPMGPLVPPQVSIPLLAFDADIDVDAILSYEWLASQHIDVLPREHGVQIHLQQGDLWVPGIRVTQSNTAVRRVRQRQGAAAGAKEGPVGLAPERVDNYTVRLDFFLISAAA